MNTPWAPEDRIALTPAGQSMASAVPASGGMSDHDLANVAQAVYLAVSAGKPAEAVAHLRELTIAASNLVGEALAKSHGECEKLRKLLGELFTLHCLTLRCETGHPCPENISTLQDFRAAIQEGVFRG